MQHAERWGPDYEPGRWKVTTEFDGKVWEVIVEPDDVRRLLVVVTAYEVY